MATDKPKNILPNRLKEWGEELIMLSEGKSTKDFVESFYVFKEKDSKNINSIFKPTLTNFIESKAGAEAYFNVFARPGEAHIFHVEWNNIRTIEDENTAFIFAAGSYTFFTQAGITTAEYSFVVRKIDNRIVLHHSSLPA